MQKSRNHKNTPLAVIPASFPMRINKYLAHKGIATRRDADELIENKRVTINGRVAVLGDKVSSASDDVQVSPKIGGAKDEPRVYLAYHKPAGVVSTNPQEDEADILETLTYKKTRVFPIGRLEKDSSGLIILSNDGRITDRLLNPQHGHEKEYEVRLDTAYSPSLLKILGDRLAHTQKHPSTLEKIGTNTFRAILRDAGNATIVRACSELGFQVKNIRRTRIVNISLDGIKEGKWREITGSELREFLQKLGL